MIHVMIHILTTCAAFLGAHILLAAVYTVLIPFIGTVGFLAARESTRNGRKAEGEK